MNKALQLIRTRTRYTFQAMAFIAAVLFILYVLAWFVAAMARFMGLL